MGIQLITSKNMEKMPYSTANVEKEDIALLHFPKQDVLYLKVDMDRRKQGLDNALSLGNLSKCKVRIVFEDIEGAKEVITTIWGITDKHIILKQNTLIPIHRIVDVNVM